MQDVRIQSFIRRTNTIEHIISNEETSSNHIAFDTSAAAITRMAKVDAKRYRTPYFSDKSTQYSAEPPLPNVRSAARGQVVQLEPRVQFVDEYMVKPVNLNDACTHVSDAVLNEVEKAKASLQKDESLVKDWASTIPGKDVEICTLGTGSAAPSKDRNVSSTLMRVPGWGNHHMGIIGLIKAWYQEVHESQPASDSRNDKKKLTIIAPDAMHSFLFEYSAIEDYGFSRLERMHFVIADPSKSKNMVLRMFGETESQSPVPPSKLGLKDIRSVGVLHTADALAVSITWPDGFKASYSGDCRPSRAFAQIGAGSTVCIHEATFSDDLIADAKQKTFHYFRSS
ncbi:hypothetical protein MRB53_040022 [Persea americana]|nr:hypothetical protein MRB53_040022 [Persea americana]